MTSEKPEVHAVLLDVMHVHRSLVTQSLDVNYQVVLKAS